MPITVTQLRQDIYRVLDEVIETGVPLEIERKGAILKIVPEKRRQKLDLLEPRDDYLRGDPEDIVHLDWSREWRP